MSGRVFISHSNTDAEVANALCQVLEASGAACWIAPRDVQPGQDYTAALAQALNDCSALIVLLSARANASQHVLREVERAADRGLRIFPIRIENVKPARGLEYLLSSVQWLDALTPDRRQVFERLATAVLAALGANGPTPAGQDSQRPTFLLRWYPPPPGSSAVLTIHEDMRQLMRSGLEGATNSERQYIVYKRRFLVTAGPTTGRSSFTLQLAPLELEMSSRNDKGLNIHGTGSLANGRPQISVQSPDPGLSRQLEGMMAGLLGSPLSISMTPKGVIVREAAGPRPSAEGEGWAAQLSQGLEFSAGANDVAQLVANNAFMTFPDEPVGVGQVWPFSRESSAMGVRMSALCEARIDAFDQSDAGQVVRITEALSYQVDESAFGRRLASSMEASTPNLRARPLQSSVSCPPSNSTWAFDVTSGALQNHSGILEMSFDSRLLLEGPGGHATFVSEGNLTTRTSVEWTPNRA